MKKRIANAAHSDRSKLKRMVRMRRYLLVERVGEDESSIGVPDCNIWQKSRLGRSGVQEAKSGGKRRK
jgi:hypothetical protein